MLAVRGALPESARSERAARAAEYAAQCFSEIPGLRTVASYAPIRGELDPAAVEEALRQAGITIAYPCIDFAANKLVLRTAGPGELVPAAFGIPEPPTDNPVVEAVDAILVPGLAADPRGHRIGYGKGFYDGLLPDLGNAHRIAFLYDFQLIAEAPNEPLDIPVHHLVTDKRLMKCEGGG